jgi:uncharacterized protein YbbC (DUF1343 family)
MNRTHIITLLTTIIACISLSANCQITKSPNQPIIPGAERTQLYFPLLKGKRVTVFANQTSMVKNTHLVDTLLSSGINVVKIFSPEHGFRGDADAGAEMANSTDKKTGLPIVSLYGNHSKPTADDLKDVDVMLFDIQDVGVRFYTYISSLQYYLEAAVENKKPLIVLDRPNPNGFYIDGPVLDTAYKSFIGLQPIPVVYGMTIGEYAYMLLGQGISNKTLSLPLYDSTPLINIVFHSVNVHPETGIFYDEFELKVIECENYDHNSRYTLPVNPSPNLKEMQAIYLYPSTCFFEGTVLSEGRGTDKPFEIFGHPSLPDTLFAFTPKPNAGSKSSKCFYQQCYGWNLSGNKDSLLQQLDCKIRLKYLLDAYRLFPGKDSFFLKNNFFNKLAGNAILMQQIKDGKTEAEIRKSWEPELIKFKAIRKKYLLYKDFAPSAP